MKKLMLSFLSIFALAVTAYSQSIPSNQFVGVNAASFSNRSLSVGISALFPSTAVPLTLVRCQAVSLNETNLCGTQVFINDEATPLFFVSPGQINLLVNSKYYQKIVNVRVRANNGNEQFARLEVLNNPGLFCASGNGRGQVAALHTADGINYYPTNYYDPDSNNFIGIPVPLRQSGLPNHLVLYGTGLSQTTKVALVRGNFTYLLNVEYVGASTFAGLDQVNVKLPENIPQAGVWNVTLVSDGVLTNTGQITLGN